MNQKLLSSSVLFILACCGLYGQGVVTQGTTSQSLPSRVQDNRPGSAPAVTDTRPGSGPGFASAPQEPPYTPLQLSLFKVQYYMRSSSPLQGGDETLAGLGDEAASDILILMGNSPPMTTAQTLTALDIVHKSFAKPTSILNGQTKPVQSLALLKILQATAVDQTVKERIAIETNFLNAVPDKLIFPPMGVPGPPPPLGSIPTR